MANQQQGKHCAEEESRKSKVMIMNLFRNRPVGIRLHVASKLRRPRKRFLLLLARLVKAYIQALQLPEQFEFQEACTATVVVLLKIWTTLPPHRQLGGLLFKL